MKNDNANTGARQRILVILISFLGGTRVIYCQMKKDPQSLTIIGGGGTL